ncbi:hypothetical protein [Streptomyces tailanensis]|uniref:hypothetical protein n=1 Tax=Streptomyces tailanensis TaxID=2569858 RepID=UPI00122E10ED|nr:hypothetical protein [Streptomyces tailanensis]
MTRTFSGGVSASGPVSQCSWPAWPSVVRAAATTAATTASCTIALLASGKASRTTPSDFTDSAHSSALDMNSTGDR